MSTFESSRTKLFELLKLYKFEILQASEILKFANLKILKPLR